jgi:hypothetical protein
MVVFAVPVLTDLEDQREQPLSDPSYCAKLLRIVGALVQIKRSKKDLLGLFEVDASLGLFLRRALFAALNLNRTV